MPRMDVHHVVALKRLPRCCPEGITIGCHKWTYAFATEGRKGLPPRHLLDCHDGS